MTNREVADAICDEIERATREIKNALPSPTVSDRLAAIEQRLDAIEKWRKTFVGIIGRIE